MVGCYRFPANLKNNNFPFLVQVEMWAGSSRRRGRHLFRQSNEPSAGITIKIFDAVFLPKYLNESITFNFLRGIS